MSLISVILNLDTRPVCSEFQGLHKGVRSRDFIGKSNLENKRKFFEGFNIEVIAHIDEHEPLTREQYDTLHDLCDCVVVRKHTKYYRGADPFHKFNDISYIQALSLARGEYVAHFDQDMAAFTYDRSIIDWMHDEVNSGRHKFVCNPSTCSPAPCFAPEYENKWWASTRFFFCKREQIDITALERAIRDPEWAYTTYDRPPRINPWTEAFLGIMANYSVIYPPVELDRWAVFPWMNYRDGVLERMNQMPYSEVALRLRAAGGDGIFWDGVDSNLLVL